MYAPWYPSMKITLYVFTLNFFMYSKSLIRVYNSKNEVEEIADMLSLADPPVITEIYDNREDKVLS